MYLKPKIENLLKIVYSWIKAFYQAYIHSKEIEYAPTL